MKKLLFWSCMIFSSGLGFSQNQLPVDSGMIYYENGIKLTRSYEFVNAREQLLKAQIWFIRQNRQEMVAKTYIQLGFQTNRIILFDESHEYFARAQKIADQYQLPEVGFYAKTAHVIAWLWDFSYSFDSLNLINSRQALIELKKQNKENIATHIINDYLEAWGEYYFKTNQPDSASYYFNKSLQIAREDNNYTSISNCYINLAIYYNIQNELDTIPFLLTNALITLKNEPNSLLQRRIYVQWISYYEKLGDDKNAVKYHKLNNTLHRKELIADRDLALSNLSKEYEKEIFEAQLGEKEVQIKYQQFTLIVISCFLALFIIFSIFYFRLYQLNKKVNQKNKYLLKEQNHRLKNNLQIISGLLNLQANRIEEETTRSIIESSQMRVHTIGLIHKQLYENSTEEVQLDSYCNELVIQILISFDIQNLHEDVYFEQIHMPSEIVNSIGLILNELLTNSCKHAFPQTIRPSLHIRLYKIADGSYKLIYKDNGPGFKLNEVNSRYSFGLTLINIMVAQLEGKMKWINTNGLCFEMVFGVEKKRIFGEKAKKHKWKSRVSARG